MSTATPIEFDISIVEASDVEARVQVRPRNTIGDPVAELERLGGTVSGPYCERARTLPATLPLETVQRPEGLLAEAVVPDPCFWTEELPYLYRLRIRYQQGGDERHHEQTIGLRRETK